MPDQHTRVLVTYKLLGLGLSLGVALLGAFLWSLQGPAQVQAAPVSPTGQDVVFLLDNSPSTITGVGSPDGNPTDPQEVRLRLTRFSVGALGLLTTTTQQRVGAISFARSTEVLVPLTPVEDWAKADQARIQALDMGTGTDFAVALEAAGKMLAESSCGVETACDVIFISDGIFNNLAQGSQNTERILQALRDRNIRVHLLVFTEPDAQSHAVWQDLLGRGLLARYETQITPRFQQSPQDVYALLFDILGAADLFDDFSSLVAPAEITREVPPYRRWVRWQIVTDQPLVPVFTVNGEPVQPLQSASDYFFWAGPMDGIWAIRFEADAVVYYREMDAALPLFIRLKPLPDSIVSGEELFVQAELITPEGVPVARTEDFSMTAALDGPEGVSALPLTPVGTQFRGVLTTTAGVGGVYTVTLSADTAPHLGIAVLPVTHTLEVHEAIPKITPILSVTPLDGLRPGDTITITLEQCTATCQPSVVLIGDGYTTTLMLNPAGSDRYQLSLSVSQTMALSHGDQVELVYIKGASVPGAYFQVPWYLGFMLAFLFGSFAGYFAALLLKKLNKPRFTGGACLDDDVVKEVINILREITRVIDEMHEDFVVSESMNIARGDAVKLLFERSIIDGELQDAVIKKIYDGFGGKA